MTRATISGTGTAGDVWLTVDEVAAQLRASAETVRRWLRAGRLRGMRPGGTKLGWRVREADLAAYLAAASPQAAYICDLCGAEFTELGEYNACGGCSALIAARCAEDPAYAAAVAAELAGVEVKR